MPYKNPVVRRYDNTQRHKRQYDLIRSQIFEKLGGKCALCGFNNPLALQVDHVNGGGTRERQLYRTKGLRTYYKDILGKIEVGNTSYQLLCANCNCIKRGRNREVK